MDNAQKAIMIGVGLFITIIVIAAVMAITGIGTDLLNKGQSQLGDISGNLQKQITDQYDNQQMSGAQVLAAVNKFYSDNSMSVVLYNGTASTTSTASVNGIIATMTAIPAAHNTVTNVSSTGVLTTGATRTPIKDYKTVGNVNEILSSSRYKSVLITNAVNATVIGVAFIQLP